MDTEVNPLPFALGWVFSDMKTDYQTLQARRLNEWEREELFLEASPFFHLYTSPVEDVVLIRNDVSRGIAISYMAIAALETGVKIDAYAIMSNHFHFILQGTMDKVQSFYHLFRHLLDVYLARSEKIKVFKNVEAGLTEITSLRQYRDEVAYVLRNPFVVRTDVNIMANEMTSAHLYYTPYRSSNGLKAKDLTVQQKRTLLKSGALTLPEEWYIVDNHVDPVSFVDYPMVESLFAHARQFVYSLLKNVEAQIEIAISHGETPVIPDEELLKKAFMICNKRYHQKGPSALTTIQKKELAAQLHKEYYASAAQLARVTGLPPKELEAMFPKAQ